MRRPRSHTLTLPDGRTLHALQWEGTGDPVVLLHGLLDCADGWAALCAAGQRPGIAFDLAGFGASDLPSRPSFAGYAEDVIAGLDALGVERFVLVGHSLGGGVATAVAERVAARVRALVLLAPAGFGRIALAEAVSIPGVRHIAHRVLPVGLGSRTVVGLAYRLVVSNGGAADDELLRRLIAHDDPGRLVAGAREATKAVVRGGLSARAFHRRRVAYDGPVLAVWGDRDRLVPTAHRAGVMTAFPHAEVRIWTGMGHHPQRERPNELAALVEEACTAEAEAEAEVRPLPGPGRRARRRAA